jgi:hypothetical protein
MPNLHPLVIRGILAASFAVGCHQYDWAFLRRCTTVAVVCLSNYLGLPVSRLGADLIDLNGTLFQFVVSCTLIDAFCGMIPLLWNLSVSTMSNVLSLVILFVALSVFNIARLEVGFVAFAYNVPWALAHEVVSGLTYFMLLTFVWTQRAWAMTPMRSLAYHPMGS